MIAFINERSLEEFVHWENALTLFLDAAHELSPTNATLRKDSSFFFDVGFKARFATLHFGLDIKPLIRQLVFSERYYECWRPGRISIDDVYLCDEPRTEFLDESLCELTEIKLRDPDADAAVFSANDSTFKRLEELIMLNTASTRKTSLRNITSVDLVKRWLTQQEGYYNPASGKSPRDFQTILEKAPERFRETNKVERRGHRRIFEEIDTGRLFFVCDMHSGPSAHLEVFASDREHVGKADMNSGNMISPKIKGRKLRL